jgi:twitching motility protein PilT
VSSQLEAILAYLERDGVTEVVISSGRPVAMRQAGSYVNLTSKPLSGEQLAGLLRGTGITLPEADGSPPASEMAVAGRRVRVQVGRRGEEIVVRFERARGQTAPIVEERVRRAMPPDEQPVRRAMPPDEQPVRRAVPPDEQPVRRAMPPDEQPVRRAAPAAEPRRAAAPAPAPAMGGDFASLVAEARQRGASDLQISTGRATAIRIAGELVPLDPDAPPLAAGAAEAMLTALLPPASQAQLAERGYTDLAIEAPDGGRLRANISRHNLGLKGTFRLALLRPYTLEELGLSKDLAKVVAHHQGLVVIAGPSGHGKTSTLNALVDLVNCTRASHVLTIEDPIEIVHPRKQAVVSQREVGPNTRSFATGLKASLREDPDVIVIGELRDRETVEIALTAAETGHLVLSTMSTPSAAKTIDRLIDMFPSEEHSQVRASLSGALRAIVAQRLVPGTSGGIVPAIELVTGCLPLATLIRDDKLYQLPNLMQRGRAYGMIRLDESLLELMRAGRISEDAALAASESKKDLAALLRPAAAAAGATPAPAKKPGLFGRKDG